MKLGVFVFSALLAILTISAVSANVLQQVSITDCSFDTISYACEASISVSCQVATSWNNTGITSAQFSVNDYSSQATRIAGSNVNGTWRATFTNDQRFADSPLEITRTAATTSTGYPCSSSESIRDVDGCYVRWENFTSENTCSCQIVRTEGPVSVANTRQVTLTPSAGCSDRTASTYVEFADYCDPGWASQQTACAPTASTTDSPFYGTTTKTYSSTNTACCALTSSSAGNTWFNHNTGSDCTPPIDHNTESVCTIQPALQGQVDVEGTNFASSYLPVRSFTAKSAGLDTNPWQALAYDFDGDGSQEIVTIQPGVGVSYVRLYSSSMTLLDSDDGGITQINTTTGQPVIAGVTKYSNGTYTFENQTKILVPATSISGSPRSKVYVYSVSANLLVLDEVVDLETNAGSTGVSCVEDECYFADLGSIGTAYRYYLDGSGEFAFPPLNGLFLLNGTYQGPLVDGPLLSNMRVQNLKPVFVKAQSQAQDDYVVFISELNVNVSGTINQRGYAMITLGGDVIGHHSLGEGTGTGSSTLTLRSPVVVGRNVYIPYEEVFAGSELEMGVYVVSLRDTSSMYLSAPGQNSNKVPYWRGTFNSNDEGISNAVAKDLNGYVQIFSRTPSDSLSEIGEISAPTIGFTGASNVNVFLPPTNLLLTQRGKGYVHSQGNHYIHTSAYSPSSFQSCVFTGYSILNGGTSISNSVSCGSSTSGNTAFVFDVETDFGCLTYAPGLGTGIYQRCASLSDPNAFVLVGSTGVVTAQGQGGYSTPINGMMLEIRQLNTPQLTNLRSSYPFQRITLSNATLGGIHSTLDNWLAAYDPNTDVLLTNTATLTKYGELVDFASGSSVAVTTDQVNYSHSYFSTTNNRVSVVAFNWDWDNPRYIDVIGRKHKISSFQPYTETIVTQSCEGAPLIGDANNLTASFKALYYNSDDHILGIISPNPFPLANSGSYGTITHSGPVFGYCDYSDESSPKLYSYGVTIPVAMTASFSNSVSATQSLPQVTMQEDDAEGDGQGFTFALATATRDATTITCTDIGATWSCVTTSTFADLCGSYGVGDATKDCVAIIGFDETRTQSVNGTTSSTETVTFDTSGTKVNSYFAPFVKRSMIGIGDATGDGNADIINSYGVYNFVANNFTNYFSNSNVGQSVVPLDQNGDGALDVLITGSGVGTALFTATSSANAILSGPLEIKNLRCTVVPGTNTANIQVAAAASSPSNLVVQLNPGDGRGFITQTTSVIGTYLLAFAKAGTFTVTAKVYDTTSPFVTDEATCQLVIPEVVGLSLTDCSIGSDGEFDYTDSVLDRGWEFATSRPGMNRQSLIPSNGKLNMLSRVSIEYPLTSCNYQTFTSEAKLIPADSVFEIKGVDETAAIRMAYSDSGPSIISDEAGNTIGSYTWDGSTYVTAAINIDTSSGQVYYFFNGVQVASKAKSFVPVAVKLTDTGLYDYVRTSVSGNKLSSELNNPNVEDLEGETQYLTQCDSDGDGVGDAEQQEGIDARRAYPNVDRYCASSNDGRCDFVELGRASSRYPLCTKEVYNYCVYSAFVYETESGPSDSGIAGGTSCTALLLGSAGLTKIVVPTGMIGWNLFLDNMMWVLAAIAIVVFVMVLTAMGRRRS